MIKFLGYEDLNPRYNAYNVMVSFPFPEKKKDSSSGSNVATVFVSPDVFESNFKGVKIGTDLPFNVGFSYVDYKVPQKGSYKAYLKL